MAAAREPRPPRLASVDMPVPGTTPTRPAAHLSGSLVAVLMALLVAILAATPASAHTALDATSPADGSTASGPVDRVELTFTLPVTVLGDGAVIEGPDGPVAALVTQEQGGVLLIATPDESLTDGSYTVTWTVAAQDGHPLDGTFTFDVTGAPPEPSASPTPTPTATPSATAAPMASTSPSPMPSAMEDGEHSDDTTLATILARAGSAIALWALLVAAGALAFAAFAMRSTDRDDLALVLAGVRWCGGLLLGGLALRVVGRSAMIAGGSLADGLTPDALSDALAGSFAWVMGLQAAGGMLIALGAWRSTGASLVAILGVLLAGAGHVLGGHSNTIEPRWLVLTADIAHLVAAAVWLGGVATLARVLRHRRRDGRPLDAARLGARFGVVAAGAFVVVGAAGVALTWAIIDELSDLWTTSWGIWLLVKVGVVLVVAVIGAYTHFRIVPRLGHGGHGTPTAEAEEHLRHASTWETVLFVGIVVATAILVASSVHV